MPDLTEPYLLRYLILAVAIALGFVAAAWVLGWFLRQGARHVQVGLIDLAKATAYHSETLMGMHKPPEEPGPSEPEKPPIEKQFEEWFAAQTFQNEEEEGDVWGRWEQLMHKRPATMDERAKARIMLASYGAPVPDFL